MKKYLSLLFIISLIMTGCGANNQNASSTEYKTNDTEYKTKDTAKNVSTPFVISEIPKDTGVYPDGYSVEYLSPEEMEEDIEKLISGLEEKHIDPYHSVTKANFYSATSALRSHLDNMNAEQFAFEITKLVALIGEAHSGVKLNSILEINGFIYPFYAVSYENEWYLFKINNDYSDYIGWKIDKIAGLSRTEVLNKLSPYISHENDIWLNEKVPQYLWIWNALYYSGILTDDTLELELSKNNEKKTLLLSPISVAKYDTTSCTTIEYKTPPTALDEVYYQGQSFNDILYIQYNTCTEDPDYPMKNFTEDIEPMLKDSKYCVVDLRYNTGGNSIILSPMIELLRKYSSEGNKVYVFIGAKTFSSAILNAIELKNKTNAIFIGTPTGGSANMYGEVRSFELPNSSLSINYSTKLFQTTDLGFIPLVPDIEVPHTLQDFIDGVDPDYEALEELISSMN